MTAAAQIEKTFREEHGRVLAALISQLGDFTLAEDALQDALVNALERWKVDGVPRNPGAWLTTVAKRRAIDRLRRASTQPVDLQAGRLQIFASRLNSQKSQHLFLDGVAPAPIDDDNRVHDLVVRSFYVARDSENRPGYPALRMKALDSAGGAPTFADAEIMPGIEDLQVQFGIDTGDYDNDGVIDAAADLNEDGIPESDGRATRYVNPDFPGLDRLQVVSVRVWLRVRGEAPEPELDDRRTYRYADVEYTPSGEERRFRRMLLTRTIMLRNSRTL